MTRSNISCFIKSTFFFVFLETNTFFKKLAFQVVAAWTYTPTLTYFILKFRLSKNITSKSFFQKMFFLIQKVSIVFLSFELSSLLIRKCPKSFDLFEGALFVSIKILSRGGSYEVGCFIARFSELNS